MQALSQSIVIAQIKQVFGSEYEEMAYIISRESGFKVNAINKSSGSYGLCQSLPKEKMATAGKDYLTNPVTQAKWCFSYVHTRYKNALQAKTFWVKNSWF